MPSEDAVGVPCTHSHKDYPGQGLGPRQAYAAEEQG